MIKMNLKKKLTNINKVATSYNISTLCVPTKNLDFKSGLPSGINLNPQ
jgi:hypothetical protein